MKKVQSIIASMLHISNNLKVIRGLTGLIQEDFAKKIDMSLSMLKKWETGNYVPKEGFNKKSLYLLSKIAGVSEDSLLNRSYTVEELFEKVQKVNKGQKEDSKSGVQGVNSGRKEESFSSFLRSIALAQQELADQLKNLSAAAESISAEELDRILEKIPPGKNSVEKKGK